MNFVSVELKHARMQYPLADFGALFNRCTRDKRIFLLINALAYSALVHLHLQLHLYYSDASLYTIVTIDKR